MDTTPEAILSELQETITEALKALNREYKKIRTGKASLDLLDGIRVEMYGSEMPLNQVANLSVSDPMTLAISPWDQNSFGPIEKAIQKSDLGLSPTNDGKLIRLSIPPLSEERRQDLVKQARKVTEHARIQIRNLRRDANDALKSLEKDGDLSEDELKRAEAEVQKATDHGVEKADQALKTKEKETVEF